MTADLVISVSALIGALINRAAGKNETWSWTTVGEVLAAGAAAVLLSSMRLLVPDELRTALEGNPFRVGLSAFLVGFLGGPGLVTLAKSLFFRVRNGDNGAAAKPIHGGSDRGVVEYRDRPASRIPPHLRVILLGIALAGTVVGCANLGLQRSSLSLDRDAALLIYSDVKREIGAMEALITRDCAAKAIPAETCTRLDAFRDKLQLTDSVFREAVARNDDFRLDDLMGLVGLAAQLARLAGHPVPILPGTK